MRKQNKFTQKNPKGVLSQLPFGFFINHNNIEKLLQPDLRPA